WTSSAAWPRPSGRWSALNSGKASKAKRRSATGARVKRGARSRARRSNGGRQALASPLAPVLLGVLLLLALGYWVTKDEQAPAPAAAPASEAGVAGEASAEAASP